MSVHRTEALTLRTYPFAESHKIVVFLTRNFGKVRAVAHGAQKGRGRFGSSFELLTQLDLTYSWKETQDLAVVKNCEIVRAFSSQHLTWEKSLYFSYFSELLNEFSREGEESHTLFRLSLAVLEAAPETTLDLLARYFELWLLKLEGVLPKLDEKLPAELSARTRQLMRLHPAQLTQLEFLPEECKRIERVCIQLIEYHLEKHLKTRKFLKELL